MPGAFQGVGPWASEDRTEFPEKVKMGRQLVLVFCIQVVDLQDEVRINSTFNATERAWF